MVLKGDIIGPGFLNKKRVIVLREFLKNWVPQESLCRKVSQAGVNGR